MIAAPPSAPPDCPTFSPVWVVGFVGHRSGFAAEAVAPVVARELGALQARVVAAGGTLHFYSSVADGTDLLALDEADRLGLPLHVVLPVPEEDFFRSFATEAERVRARARLAAIRAEPGRHTWRLAPTSMKLPDAYFEADTRIVDAADFLLVVWDGRRERGLGGTAQIVALAGKNQLPIIRVNATTGRVSHSRRPGPLSPDPMCARLVERGILRLGPPADTAPAAMLARAEAVKSRVSDVAKRDAKWFRQAATWFLICNVVAASLGAISGIVASAPAPSPAAGGLGAGVFHLQHGLPFWLGLGELGLLGFGLWFKLHGRRKRIRDEWVNVRFAAEVCRGLRHSAGLLDPLAPLAARDRLGPPPAHGATEPGSTVPDWRRFALTFALELRAGLPADDWRTRRATYLDQRLRGRGGQLEHYRKHGVTPWGLRVFDAIAPALGWTAALVLLAALGNRLLGLGWGDAGWGRAVFAVLPAVLPLLAALPSVMISTLDYDRRAVRYPDMLQKLRQTARILPALQTEESVRQLVQRTEAILLEENTEWYFATSRVDPN